MRKVGRGGGGGSIGKKISMQRKDKIAKKEINAQ